MKPNEIAGLVEQRWPRGPVASTGQLADSGLESWLVAAAVEAGVILRLRQGAYTPTRGPARVRTSGPTGSRRAADLLDVVDARSESAGGDANQVAAVLVRPDEVHAPHVEIPTDEGLFRADFADDVTGVAVPRGKCWWRSERGNGAGGGRLGGVFRLRWKHLDRPGELRRRLLDFLGGPPGMQKRPWPA
jgi:hypothetical protein